MLYQHQLCVITGKLESSRNKWVQNLFIWDASCDVVSSCLSDATHIYRFPIVHMVKTHFLLENLSISEPSLGILHNFQRRSALPNIKYNCAVLFLRQVYYLFKYAPKTKNSTEKKILIDFNVKTLKCIF